MNEIRNFYFENQTTDFDLIDRFLVLNGDVTRLYYIEQWLRKHIAVSHKNTFYHRLITMTEDIINLCRKNGATAIGIL